MKRWEKKLYLIVVAVMGIFMAIALILSLVGISMPREFITICMVGVLLLFLFITLRLFSKDKAQNKTNSSQNSNYPNLPIRRTKHGHE